MIIFGNMKIEEFGTHKNCVRISFLNDHIREWIFTIGEIDILIEELRKHSRPTNPPRVSLPPQHDLFGPVK